MNTLVDFITHVKAVEYILSLAGIAAFLILWESLKSKPFRSLVKTGREDRAFIEQAGGFRLVMKNVGRIAAAPFIGLAYIVILPVGFFVALAAAAAGPAVRGVARVAGKSTAFEWRPMEAYLAGRKKHKKEKDRESGTGDAR